MSMELSTYLRINSANTVSLSARCFIADEESYVAILKDAPSSRDKISFMRNS